MKTATCIFFLVLTASLSGQFDVATLTGTVTDTSGAVVPGVQVTATNEATNIVASVTANETGRYLFPSLRPGTYKITATHQGFKQFVSAGVTLQVNQAGRLDIQLAVGQ